VTTYTKWLVQFNQPDNANGIEDVVVMDWTEEAFWIDTNNTNVGAATMCEKSITSPLPSM
jgi:hypothetical protein